MADSIKNGSYEQIKEYIDTNFIKSKKGKAKGVTQLLLQIDRLNNNCQAIEDFKKIGLDKSRFIIFPVIITKDFSFNVNGINHYLNNQFKKEIKSKGYPFFLITDLILVDLKSLMDWSDDLVTDKITLPSLLYNYLLKISYFKEATTKENGSKSVLDSLGSFSHLMIPKENRIITETKEFQEILDRLKLEK